LILLSATYPQSPAGRSRWILARRPERNAVNPYQPSAFFFEEECAESGEVIHGVTIFLVNRECPWRCLMCDLWKNTMSATVPVGAIPAQIDHALAQLSIGSDRLAIRAPRQIKLYNSGSFFDPRAIPPEDYDAIAGRLCEFERVIVECHPALVSERCRQFAKLLKDSSPARTGSSLEVAMGLETVQVQVLEKLNKRMTLASFQRAANFLRANDMGLRAFILVKPPFLNEEADALYWAKRTMDYAFDCGATALSLIPTRLGNGALESLQALDEFSPPRLQTLEAAAEYGLGLGRGRVFADLWGLEKFADCPTCFGVRRSRLNQMNLRQEVPPAVVCERCGSGVG
jgi:radical SAM enzyme (TIGR01210 family)